MPQIAQLGEFYASQLFWLLVFFGALFVVVGLGMLPKIQATVDARDGQIAADLKAAEGARDAADRLEEDYRAAMDKSRAEATKLTGAAKDKGAAASSDQLAKAEAEIAAKAEAAAERIRAGRAAAMAEIEGAAADAAQAIVAKITGASVGAAEAKAAVKKELARA